ncbi:hypothetical protein GOP47_0019517 [Adiantum capillus-veneris]|uniref:SHSP domain-containing protein n=1 Tax=Adiantum capillus-veneris TaxID=13818 RepID=A0A9D4Z8P5_ADICA|nr:hypothetical protein GOP47_0019517 [Adiantum capillus-veneris]
MLPPSQHAGGLGLPHLQGQTARVGQGAGGRWVCAADQQFLRRFRLPDNAKVEQVQAAMENSVLTVTVPKMALPEPKSSVKSVDISG